jgi:hypothetical protein
MGNNVLWCLEGCCGVIKVAYDNYVLWAVINSVTKLGVQ